MVIYTYFSLLNTNKSASKTPGKGMGLNVDQELFGVFAFYNAVVILKMLLMAFLTARWISDDDEEEINQKWTKYHLL